MDTRHADEGGALPTLKYDIKRQACRPDKCRPMAARGGKLFAETRFCEPCDRPTGIAKAENAHKFAYGKIIRKKSSFAKVSVVNGDGKLQTITINSDAVLNLTSPQQLTVFPSYQEYTYLGRNAIYIL